MPSASSNFIRRPPPPSTTTLAYLAPTLQLQREMFEGKTLDEEYEAVLLSMDRLSLTDDSPSMQSETVHGSPSAATRDQGESPIEIDPSTRTIVAEQALPGEEVVMGDDCDDGDDGDEGDEAMLVGDA